MSLVSSVIDRLSLAAGLALVIKVTLVFVIGAVAVQLLRRRSAAVRHFAWLLTVMGVLGVTVFTVLPGGKRFAVPYWPETPSADATLASADGSAGDASDRPGTTPHRESMGIFESPGTSNALRVVPPWARAWPWVARLWLLGVCLALAWFVVGHLALARLSRRAEVVADPAWRSLLDRLAAESGLTLVPTMKFTAAVGTPLVCGLWRPTILLPTEAESWSWERRRVVLLHELAHAVRHDPLAQSIAWLACSLYWFHPAAWIAAGRLRAESERACDDRVLSCGIPGPDYASHLLGLARRARAMRLAGSVAIAMARRSTLEGRLLSLLDEGLRRGALTLRSRAVGVAGLVLAIAGLGLARPVARAVADFDGGDAGSASLEAFESDDDDAKGGSSFERAMAARPGETLSLELDTGGGVTIRGWDRDRVEVRGVLRGRDGPHQNVGFERVGSRVVLRVTPQRRVRSFSTSNRFEFRVPRRFDVQIASGGGEVTIVDLEGTFRGNTGGGGFVIERARGRANLSTGGGDIRVTDCDLSGSVSTGGGLVRISRVRGGLRGHSGSGPVLYADGPDGDASKEAGDLGDLELDHSRTTIIHGGESQESDETFDEGTKHGSMPAGMLNVEKAGGAIRLLEAPNGVRANTGGGDIEIGKSGAMVDASTGGGDIRIGPTTGSVRAGTGAGDVRVVLAPGRARRTVDVTSGQGQVVLELPVGMKLDLELETSYTHSSHPSRIRSEVPIKTEPTTDWDNREGTPRRYVRAFLETGSGVKVRVKTVNGDIEIRRIGRGE
jgi:beta-lactamase regulating signal transducer with metallopeptidase domain